jgi:Leucine-rich repeat (LRR) protein
MSRGSHAAELCDLGRESSPAQSLQKIRRYSEGRWKVLRSVCLLPLVLICCSSFTLAGPFADPNLERVIREQLQKRQINKAEIDPADLKGIFFLDARQQGIENLQGLELCTNLADVKLSGNAIQDLSPLAGLKNIQLLMLAQNKISDLQPLKELVKLQFLDLNGNQIQSMQGLEQLTNLRTLYLSQNQISDLTPLQGLRQLRSLYLNENQLQSLAPLAELPWVSTLAIKGNRIADLSPLARYTELRYTFLEGNPLSELATLVEMAEQDANGPRRFAPYWYVYLDEDRLSATGQAELKKLRELGVRVNIR